MLGMQGYDLYADIVVIEPIEDIDVSNKAVGEKLSIECRVRTCHRKITVSILKGSQLIELKEIFETVGNVSLVADVTISSDTDDHCACRVRLQDGTVFSEEFRITGILYYDCACMYTCTLSWIRMYVSLSPGAGL